MNVRVPANAKMAGNEVGIFNYDRPIIRKLAAEDRQVSAQIFNNDIQICFGRNLSSRNFFLRAGANFVCSGEAYTYNFEGGVILSVFGINFDYQAQVVIGGWPCQINGTYYINSSESSQACYQPPYVCESGTNKGLPCADIDYSTDCPGGTCTVSLA